jgi:hypothetical protein
MPRFKEKLAARLPLDFRVLFHQFLLRVVDLEALSIEADIPRFLGQFAGVLMMFSMINALGLLIHPPINNMAYVVGMLWTVEQRMIFTMMLVVGLFAVISWDSIFPDRRDIIVLAPLPLHSHIILIAKLAAVGAVLGLAVLALNFAVSCALSLLLGGIARFFIVFAAYSFTMIAASIFLYGSVIAVQGLMALLLPRRLFLRLSAVLQIAAFALFICAYFLEGNITSPSVFVLPAKHRMLAWSPPYWFFALFNQLIGSLPPALTWLAQRAWIGLAIAVSGALVSLVLCYVRTMRKTVEEPDLVPGRRGFHLPLGGVRGLRGMVVLFTVRTLARSRHHRVILAFYLSIVLALMLSALRRTIDAGGTRPFGAEFPIVTTLMMAASVLGFQKVFSIPISLTANWVLRTTQVLAPERYIAATRLTLLLFAVVPAWLLAAAIGAGMRPLEPVAAHLAILAVAGVLMADLSLTGFHKVPFTCSLLPGSTNFQLFFWAAGAGALLLPIVVTWGEMPAPQSARGFGGLMGGLTAVSVAVWALNRRGSKSAQLYFEELPEQILVTLSLSVAPAIQQNSEPAVGSSPD